MNLRAIAAADHRRIVEEDGHPIMVTNPSGRTLDMIGLSTDIHMLIDPETGQSVSGRKAHVGLCMMTLLEAGMGTPSGKSEGEPWLVRFADVLGKSRTFKVAEGSPDRTFGRVDCALEAYATEPL